RSKEECVETFMTRTLNCRPWPHGITYYSLRMLTLARCLYKTIHLTIAPSPPVMRNCTKIRCSTIWSSRGRSERHSSSRLTFYHQSRRSDMKTQMKRQGQATQE